MTRRTEQRRLAGIAAAALSVIAVSTLAPVESEAAPITAPVAAAAPVAALSAPLPATPKAATVRKPAATKPTIKAAALAPYRAGTPAFAKWWARRIMATRFHWTSPTQYQCLVRLWQRESNWLVSAYNRGSGATGIPQAVPGSKMRSAGADWRTNAVTQIRWGLGYIKHVYGTPCGAWSHSQARGWY